MDKNSVRQIKAYMALADTSPVKIARKIGVTRTWVSLIVNGHQKSRRIRKAIADAVGKKVEDLWPDGGNKAA